MKHGALDRVRLRRSQTARLPGGPLVGGKDRSPGHQEIRECDHQHGDRRRNRRHSPGATLRAVAGNRRHGRTGGAGRFHRSGRLAGDLDVVPARGLRCRGAQTDGTDHHPTAHQAESGAKGIVASVHREPPNGRPENDQIHAKSRTRRLQLEPVERPRAEAGGAGVGVQALACQCFRLQIRGFGSLKADSNCVSIFAASITGHPWWSDVGPLIPAAGSHRRGNRRAA
jgi:hypothetical protein